MSWPVVRLGRWGAQPEDGLPAGPVRFFEEWEDELDPEDKHHVERETYLPLSALSSPEVIEAAARAEFEADGGEWESFDEASREEYREGQRVAMSAAIQALQGKEDHAA